MKYLFRCCVLIIKFEKMEDRIISLILKYENKTITKSEFNNLSEWVQETDENKKEMVELLKLIRKSKIVECIVNINDKEVLDKLKTLNINKHKVRRLKYIYYAASFLLLICISVLVLFKKQDVEFTRMSQIINSPKSGAILRTPNGEIIYLSNTEDTITIKDKSGSIIGKDSKAVLSYSNISGEKPEIHTISVPICGEYMVVLSDGTEVWLNSGSEFSYPTKFTGNRRVVKLKGEGYFEVKTNKDKPFIVNTEVAEIKVLGTKFNISAYESDEFVRTTLKEGSVVVSNKAESVRLEPGQQAGVLKVGGKPIEVKDVDVDIYTAWAHGVFEFQSMRMEDIAEQLSRWYGVEFFFMREDLKGLKFTGAAKRMDSLNDLLKKIEKTTEIKFNIKKRSVIVK